MSIIFIMITSLVLILLTKCQVMTQQEHGRVTDGQKIVFNQILSNLLQNSRILYNKYNNTKMSIKDFQLAIICNRIISVANKDDKARKHFFVKAAFG